MTTDPTSYGLRLLGVLAAVLGVQSLGSAAPQPGDALMLLSSEGAVAGLGDGLRRGFSLAQEQAQICGAKPTQWSVGWLPPGTNPAKKLRERPLPPLLLAPAAAPLVETGLLAEDRHRQILLPLQRGASLQQLASRPGSDRLWPVAPARSLTIDALVKALVEKNLRSFMLVTDGSADQQLLADRFLEGMRGQGGVLQGPDLQARAVDPNKPEELKLLVSDADWYQPASLVVMTPSQSPLMQAILKQSWPEGMELVWNVPPTDNSSQAQIGVELTSRGPAWESFQRDFLARYGYKPGTVEAAGYDSGLLVALAASDPKITLTNGMKGFDPMLKPKSVCQNLKHSLAGQAARPLGAGSNMDMKAAIPPTALLEVIQRAADGSSQRKRYNLGGN